MVKVKEIFLDLLNEDLKTEVVQIISMSVLTLVQHVIMPNQHPQMSMKEESKPFMRELVKLMTGCIIEPGDGHMVYFRILADDAGNPMHMIIIEKKGSSTFTPVTVFVRFLCDENLYSSCYDHILKNVHNVLISKESGLYFSKYFYVTLNAKSQENPIFFGVLVD